MDLNSKENQQTDTNITSKSRVAALQLQMQPNQYWYC